MTLHAPAFDPQYRRPSLTVSGGSLRLGSLAVSLADTEWLANLLTQEALAAHTAGLNSKPAARQAVQAYSAVKLCKRWRAAAGWGDPYSADRAIA